MPLCATRARARAVSNDAPRERRRPSRAARLAWAMLLMGRTVCGFVSRPPRTVYSWEREQKYNVSECVHEKNQKGSAKRAHDTRAGVPKSGLDRMLTGSGKGGDREQQHTPNGALVCQPASLKQNCCRDCDGGQKIDAPVRWHTARRSCQPFPGLLQASAAAL